LAQDDGQFGASPAPPFADVAEALGLGMVYQIAVKPDWSGSHTFTYVSPNCEALNGVSAEAVMADPQLLYGMILPEWREAFEAAEAAAIAGDGRFSIELQVRLPDGRICWRRIASARTYLEDGTAVWNGLISDITEAKRTAEELEAQRSRLQVAVEATQLGFWEWNPRSNELNWSERNKAIFGLPSDAPITIAAYLAMIHPDDRQRCVEVYQQARDRPDGFRARMEFKVAGEPAVMR
jgi:PAS domain S-box-containing protein